MTVHGDFCISIVSHGQGALIRALLADLLRHCGSALPIVLTLNVPEDETFLADCAELSLTVVRNASPKGFGANHNAAFQSCSARWFAVLNPDLRLPDNPFPALTRVAEQPGMGVVAPRVVNSQGEVEDAVREVPTPWSVAKRFFGYKRVIEPSVAAMRGRAFYWLAGMFLVFDANAYRQLGGFDERFFLYYEDYDICARFYRQGYQLAVARESNVVHDGQRTSRRSLRYLRWHVTSLLRVWSSVLFWRLAVQSESSLGR
jgi:N-acetylglucosaminyl-diphospho-decaprenol L-rhamnosyltransferase